MGQTHVGPRNCVSDGRSRSPVGRGTFEGGPVPAIVKYRDYAVCMSCAKMTRLIEMMFGCLTLVGLRNIVLDEVQWLSNLLWILVIIIIVKALLQQNPFFTVLPADIGCKTVMFVLSL